MLHEGNINFLKINEVISTKYLQHYKIYLFLGLERFKGASVGRNNK